MHGKLFYLNSGQKKMVATIKSNKYHLFNLSSFLPIPIGNISTYKNKDKNLYNTIKIKYN
jgi:hypothetical protein